MTIFGRSPLIIPVLVGIYFVCCLSFYDLTPWAFSFGFVAMTVVLLAIGSFICLFKIREIRGANFYFWLFLGVIFLMTFIPQFILLLLVNSGLRWV
jgi:hypothetical protein